MGQVGPRIVQALPEHIRGRHMQVKAEGPVISMSKSALKFHVQG